MTQEIYGAKWQDDVVAIAVENGNVELNTEETETLAVRAIFNGSMLPQRKPNSAFTFAVERTPEATATGVQVGENTGIIMAGSQAGTCIISVTLKEAPVGLEPAYVKVTVAG